MQTRHRLWNRAVSLLFLTGCGSWFVPKASLRDLPVEEDLAAGRAAGTGAFDHSDWGAVLAASVDEAAGRVDYAAVPRDRLSAYVQALETAPLRDLGASEQKALLINAYNALTLQLIVSQPALPSSIRDLDDPWGSRRWVVGGHTLSLDDLEHGLLRPIFQDPRLHFALNCASVGCPPLRRAPFTPDSLDAQLDAAARDTLARAPWLRVDGDALRVTRLLQWYGDDFTAAGWSPRAETRQAWLARVGPPSVAAAVQANPEIPLRFADYDWTLNSVSTD